ncbi:MAG: hypothetical protein IKH54_05210 [Bacilli bacterium]|nr:hypothetical protein [Bacilli bacterium]
MYIDKEKCDLKNDYFHFTNKDNVNGIIRNGLLLSKGAASKIKNHESNVSVSKGAKGILGILNSFIFVFSELKCNKVPEEFRKYFDGVNFNSNSTVGLENACTAISNKLKDEVYFKVDLDEEQLERAHVGGFGAAYDIRLSEDVDKSKVHLVTDSDLNILSAYDFASYIYDKTESIDIYRKMNSEFYYMMDRNNGSDRKYEPFTF